MTVFQGISTYFYNNPIEFWGFVFTLVCVWLNTKEHIAAWFFAILSATLYAFVYFKSKIYAEFSLQIFFILLSMYGWYSWLFASTGKTHKQLHITRISLDLGLYLLLVLAFVSLAVGVVLDKFSDTDVPYIDAFTTVLSLIAQWLLARKILENWLVWIIANIIYVYLFWYKSLYLTSFLFFILLLLSVKGFLDWKRRINLNNSGHD